MKQTSPIRIVIADDHPIFRRGLVEVLQEDGAIHIAGECGDGAGALRLVRDHDPDLVLLDVRMPGLGGIDVARRLWEEQSPVRVVLLTMCEDAALFNEAMNLGVQGYVLKENAVTELLEAIRLVAAGGMFVSPTLTPHILRRAGGRAELRRNKPGLDRLTPTECRILRLIAEDRTTKEIADLLGISSRTVDTHRQNISGKLHLSGTHSLLKFAYDNKMHL